MTSRQENVDKQMIFDMYDEDRDGYLESADAIKAMRALGHVISQKEATELEVTLDCDFEGQCDFQKWCDLLDEILETTPNVTKRMLGAAVRGIDDDHDGKVDKDELVRLLTNVGEPLDEDELEDFLANAPMSAPNTIAINAYVKKMVGKTTRRLSLFKQGPSHAEQEA